MAIITLSDLKAHLGITVSSQDVALQAVVDATNLFVESYCHRKFDETEYDEIYDGTGTNALVLKNRPVTEITTITVYDEEITEREDMTDETGYYYKDLESGIIFYPMLWERARGNIRVEYKAGYEVMPADLVYATLETATFFWNTRKRAGILSENLGSYGYRLATGLENLPGGELTVPSISVKLILDRYRENFFGELVY